MHDRLPRVVCLEGGWAGVGLGGCIAAFVHYCTQSFLSYTTVNNSQF